MPKKIDTEEFIRRSKIKHGDKFDYSLSVYTRKDDKIIVICPVHGQIEQFANAHMRGFGCAKCASDQSGKDRTHTKEQFIEKAILKHGNGIFDYSSVEYINSRTNVKIKCLKHDYEFLIPPHTHISNHHHKKGGCRLCRIDATRTALKKGKEFYLPKILQIIEGKYLFSQVPDDIENHQKVIIHCPEHGDFDIRVGNLLKGKGCPKCANYGFSLTKPAYFYVIKVTDNVIKFGITSDVKRRLYQINRESCFDCTIIHQWYFSTGDMAKEIEDTIKSNPDIITSVVNRCDMGTGYQETTYSSNLPLILSIVDEFTNNLS